MTFDLKSILLLSLVAVTALLGRNSAEAAELKMSIRVTAPGSTESLRLHVTFENVSDKDTVLNLGMMIGNGRVHMPDAVRLILIDSGGSLRELHFSDKRGGIAGRVDDYIVPLRTGSSYMISDAHTESNERPKPHTANPAMALLITTLRHRRGVADAERWAKAVELDFSV